MPSFVLIVFPETKLAFNYIGQILNTGALQRNPSMGQVDHWPNTILYRYKFNQKIKISAGI